MDEQETGLVVTNEQSVMVVEPTFQEIVDVYLWSALDSPNTRRAYARHLVGFQSATGCGRLSELTGAQLADYRAKVMAAAHAPATQAQTLAAVRSFLSWTSAIQAHQLPEEVIKATLRTPTATVQTRYEVLSEPEIVALFRAANDPKTRALLGVMLGAGLRVSEVSGLDIPDLVEDGDGAMSLLVRQGKGRRDRMVPIQAEVAGLLLAYLEKTGRYLNGRGAVFVAEDRGVGRRRDPRMSARGIALHLKFIRNAAMIRGKRMSPHSLRHTYAIRCLRAGASVVAVSKLLGHSSLVTTQRYVDHLAVSELRSSVPKLPVAPIEPWVPRRK